MIAIHARVAVIAHRPQDPWAENSKAELQPSSRLSSARRISAAQYGARNAAFVACGPGVCAGQFAFAICRQCGKVIEIPLSDPEQAALRRLAPDQILPEQVTVEIAGLCEACRH